MIKLLQEVMGNETKSCFCGVILSDITSESPGIWIIFPKMISKRLFENNNKSNYSSFMYFKIWSVNL